MVAVVPPEEVSAAAVAAASNRRFCFCARCSLLSLHCFPAPHPVQRQHIIQRHHSQ